MKKFISFLILSTTLTTYLSADVFMTELTDPQNSSDAGRYVELYNNGDSDVDLSTGWKIQRWTNGNADPTASSIKDLTGTISAGGFYIICNDADKYSATYGLTCDQDIGTGGAADSNGDDNMAILDPAGVIADMFGVAGEDGTGTGHEFEDGRAERAEGVTAANATWDEAEWNIDNDSGGGDGNQYAPEGFDPGAWIGAGPASDTCEDESACNTGADGACEYPDTGYDCDGNCIAELDCAGECGGSAVEDCTGECGGETAIDDCGECGGDNSSCSVSVTFSVDMTIEGVVGDVKVRTSTVNGEYNPSDWNVMDDNGDGTYSSTLSLLTGVEYGYNFNNSDGSGYESGSGLGDCAGGNYGNDRYVTPGDADLALDVVCWESCDACPEIIPGCTDETALNYDETATEDDGSCFYEWPDDNLFFSEAAEGSSNNKYLEIYNASDGDVDLSGYSLSSCSNGCDYECFDADAVNEEECLAADGTWANSNWDYPDNVTFEAGTMVASGDVFVVCHGSSDEFILAECDFTFTYLSNGDDVFALTQIGSGVVLDIIGTIGEDPGSGWEVAGVSNGTKDHTIVRKASVSSGTTDWAASAGTNADDSQWIVLDQNTWYYLGSHPHEEFDYVVEAGSYYYSPSDLSIGIGQTVEWWNVGGNHDVNGVASTITLESFNNPEDFSLSPVTGPASIGTYTFTVPGYYQYDCSVGSHAVNGMVGSVTVGSGGCTDSAACNHDADADFDDGSCLENDCAGECGGSAVEDECGECNGDGPEENYDCDGNCTLDVDCNGECGGSAVEDECGECGGDGSSCACAPGDVNGDGTLDVLDVVSVVGGILDGAEGDACADMNGDGTVDVLDVVSMVNIILVGRTTSDATEAKLNIVDGSASLDANGFIGAVQMTLSHGGDFGIELTDRAMVADYRTNGNSTRLIVVAPDSDELFTASGDFIVEEIIVANSNTLIDVTLPTELALGKAYPNPFNPSTSVNVFVPSDGFVSLGVYNVMGQKVATLHSGNMSAGSYTFTWNASDMTSGVYFVRVESAGDVSVQKVMLMK